MAWCLGVERASRAQDSSCPGRPSTWQLQVRASQVHLFWFSGDGHAHQIPSTELRTQAHKGRLRLGSHFVYISDATHSLGCCFWAGTGRDRQGQSHGAGHF